MSLRLTPSRFLKPLAILTVAVACALPSIALADDRTPPTGERPPVREPRTPADRGAGKTPPKPGTPGEKARRERAPARPSGFLGWVASVKELKLTDDQTKKLDGIVSEFETAQKEWKDKNGEKAKQLDEKVREEKKSGEVSEATKKAIEELNSSRPKVDQYRDKVVAILTEEQKKELEAKQHESRVKGEEARKENREKGREEARKNRENRKEGEGKGTGGEGDRKKAR